MSDTTILFSFCAMLFVPCLVAWDSAGDKAKAAKSRKSVAAPAPVRINQRVSSEAMQKRRAALSRLEIPEFVNA